MAPYLSHLQQDYYTFLSLSQDAGFDAVRGRVRAALSELEGLRARQLSSAQRALLDSVLTRVRDAGETLGNLTRRALYDAGLGNFRGVECCLAAGLTVTQLETLHREFLTRKPSAAGAARVHILTGNAYERDGQLAKALDAYERGLAADPLDLQLLQRYRTVRRALAQRPFP
ncbi:tetratricopeptide repeat protein [Stigmatella aurantiaca]|uniref:tetratricopeptide repeat protein n=1 Tax=Stigmatella aurantiaca TaxID=41 RepID=UPI003B2858B5